MNIKALLWISLMLISPVAMASGWQIGGGVALVNFDDDLEDVDSGIGGVFSAAYQHNRHFAFDFAVGGSVHEEDRANEDAVYSFVLAGGKLTLGEGDTRPYIAFGISFNYIDFDEFQEIDGDGTYFAIGADFLIRDSHSVNISFRSNQWDGEDDESDYDVDSEYLLAAYNFRF